MSVESGAATADKPHLTRQRKSNNTKGYDLQKPRERWCDECGARVTVSRDGGCEYGHFRGCDHKLEVDRGWSP